MKVIGAFFKWTMILTLWATTMSLGIAVGVMVLVGGVGFYAGTRVLVAYREREAARLERQRMWELQGGGEG